MARITRPSRKLWVGAGAAVAALAAVVGDVAYSAIPAADGTITACYNMKAGGALRLIDAESGQTCRAGETEITWAKDGVPGPQGPQGEQGEPGQDGEQGPPGPAGGLSGYEVVTSEVVTVEPGGSKLADAVCPAGKVATGGGIRANFQPSITSSFPFVDGTTWRVIVRNDSESITTFRATAVCVNAA